MPFQGPGAQGHSRKRRLCWRRAVRSGRGQASFMVTAEALPALLVGGRRWGWTAPSGAPALSRGPLLCFQHGAVTLVAL